MYYGVEQSTDQRCPNTVIKKFTSKKALNGWLKNSGNFTYGDPEGARNWHHTFREGYEIYGRINFKDPIFKDAGTSTYPRNRADNMATYLWRNAVHIKYEEEIQKPIRKIYRKAIDVLKKENYILKRKIEELSKST